MPGVTVTTGGAIDLAAVGQDHAEGAGIVLDLVIGDQGVAEGQTVGDQVLHLQLPRRQRTSTASKFRCSVQRTKGSG